MGDGGESSGLRDEKLMQIEGRGTEKKRGREHGPVSESNSEVSLCGEEHLNFYVLG